MKHDHLFTESEILTQKKIKHFVRPWQDKHIDQPEVRGITYIDNYLQLFHPDCMLTTTN
jgi:hypothetical protein